MLCGEFQWNGGRRPQAGVAVLGFVMTMTNSARTLRRWNWVHKWSSLVCTVFLLIICITGLPLIFHDEIDGWLDGAQTYAELPKDAPRANVDRLAAQAHQHFPNEVVRAVFFDDDEPQAVVTLAPTQDADLSQNHWMRFDARTGELLKVIPSLKERPLTFLDLMLRLHVDLFAGLPGNLFLATMALLFVAAIVSGLVLYGPFMRKLDFGDIRYNRSGRVKWLDLHNLLGVVTVAWTLVLGVTGIFNELSKPLFNLWRATEVSTLIASYKDKPMPEHLSSAEAAFEKAKTALPDRFISSITYPTTASFGTPHHYVIWTKGNEPLTSRIASPVLIDAETGEVTATPALPWYLTALQISRPLHFGDYGGLPLKIIWAALDLVTIVVLASGLYLWLVRGSSPVERRAAKGRRLSAPLSAPAE